MKDWSKLMGIGTWGIGGTWERDESTIDASMKVLERAFELGITRIDTAERYAEGLAEEIIGKAIAGVPRRNVHITSKVWRDHLAYDDVLLAAEGSLKRLNTPYIDLYLIHWPSDTIPVAETARAMEKLVSEGMVKEIGLSNFSGQQIEEAQNALSSGRFIANQIHYNLVTQDAARDVIPYCKKHGVDVIAYKPIERGKVVGSTSVITELAKKYEKTETQIALNWIMMQDIEVIPATLSIEHLEGNAGARSFEMSAEDVQRLKTV